MTIGKRYARRKIKWLTTVIAKEIYLSVARDKANGEQKPDCGSPHLPHSGTR